MLENGQTGLGVALLVLSWAKGFCSLWCFVISLFYVLQYNISFLLFFFSSMALMTHVQLVILYVSLSLAPHSLALCKWVFLPKYSALTFTKDNGFLFWNRLFLQFATMALHLGLRCQSWATTQNALTREKQLSVLRPLFQKRTWSSGDINTVDLQGSLKENKIRNILRKTGSI